MLESNNGVMNGRWVHPLAKPLEIDRNGPFVVLDDGSLGTVDEHGFRISKDDGKTWGKGKLGGRGSCRAEFIGKS